MFFNLQSSDLHHDVLSCFLSNNIFFCYIAESITLVYIAWRYIVIKRVSIVNPVVCRLQPRYIYTTEWKANKCVSRLAIYKSHLTALRDADAPNSNCPASLAADFDICFEEPTLLIPEVLPPQWLHTSQSSPKYEKTCYTPIPLTMPNFVAVGQTVSEKSLTFLPFSLFVGSRGPWAKVHQSVWWRTGRSPLTNYQISSPSDNPSTTRFIYDWLID